MKTEIWDIDYFFKVAITNLHFAKERIHSDICSNNNCCWECKQATLFFERFHKHYAPEKEANA